MKILRNNVKSITIFCITTEMLDTLESPLSALQFHIFVLLKHSDNIYCNNTISSFLISCFSDSQMTFRLTSIKKISFSLLPYTCCPAIKMPGFQQGGTSINVKVQQALEFTNGKQLTMSATDWVQCDSNYIIL